MGEEQHHALRLEKEEAGLVKAEQDIAAGQMRITEQELRIEALRAGGHDTMQAERLLGNLFDSLAEWNAHRAEILRLIRTLRASPWNADRGSAFSGQGSGASLLLPA